MKEQLQAVSHDVYRFTHLPLEALLPSCAPQTLDGTRHPGVCSPHHINSPESVLASPSPELFCLSHPHKGLQPLSAEPLCFQLI